MLRVISGQKEEFFVRLINKLIEGGEEDNSDKKITAENYTASIPSNFAK